MLTIAAMLLPWQGATVSQAVTCGQCWFCIPAALPVSGSAGIATSPQKRVFLVPAALSGPGCASQPSGHVSLHSKNAAGHVSLHPSPVLGCPWVEGGWVCRAGAGSCPAVGPAAFQQHVAGFASLCTSFISNLFLRWCFSFLTDI